MSTPFWTFRFRHLLVLSLFLSCLQLSLPFFFCLYFLPFQPIFYHYSRTGYEEKTTMRRLFLPNLSVRSPIQAVFIQAEWGSSRTNLYLRSWRCGTPSIEMP